MTAVDTTVCQGSEMLGECNHATCGFVDCPLCYGLGVLEGERWDVPCPRCLGDRTIPVDDAPEVGR